MQESGIGLVQNQGLLAGPTEVVSLQVWFNRQEIPLAVLRVPGRYWGDHLTNEA